jgi:hypothetical protein
MRQPSPPQSKSGLTKSWNGKNSSKFLFSDLIPLRDGILARIFKKGKFLLEFWRIISIMTRFFMSLIVMAISLALTGNGELRKGHAEVEKLSRNRRLLARIDGYHWTINNSRYDLNILSWQLWGRRFQVLTEVGNQGLSFRDSRLRR